MLNNTSEKSDFLLKKILDENNEGNFGPSKFLLFLDNSICELCSSLKLTGLVSSNVYNNLYTKEITLDSRQPNNFNELTIKYKSGNAISHGVDVTYEHHTMLKLNHELSKLEQILSKVAANKIIEFIRKLVYYNSKDNRFDIEVYTDELHLSLTLFSPKEMQSVTVSLY